MAIGLRIRFDGGTQDQYDALHGHMNIDSDPPQGIIFHAGGPIDGGWGIIDFWESRDAFDSFAAGRLQPAMQEQATARLPFLRTSRSSRYITSPSRDRTGPPPASGTPSNAAIDAGPGRGPGRAGASGVEPHEKPGRTRLPLTSPQTCARLVCMSWTCMRRCAVLPPRDALRPIPFRGENCGECSRTHGLRPAAETARAGAWSRTDARRGGRFATSISRIGGP